jgi:hypothetical protein
MTLDALMGEVRPSFTKPIYTDLTHFELARLIQRQSGSTGSQRSILKFIGQYFDTIADGRHFQLLYSKSDGYGLFYYTAATRLPSSNTFVVESRVIIHGGVFAFVVKTLTEMELRQRMFENPNLNLTPTTDQREDFLQNFVLLYMTSRDKNHRYIRACQNAPPVVADEITSTTTPSSAFTVPPGTNEAQLFCHYAACSSVIVQSSLKVCGACKCVRYCTAEHGKADWRSHQFSCPHISVGLVLGAFSN